MEDYDNIINNYLLGLSGISELDYPDRKSERAILQNHMTEEASAPWRRFESAILINALIDACNSDDLLFLEAVEWLRSIECEAYAISLGLDYRLIYEQVLEIDFAATKHNQKLLNTIYNQRRGFAKSLGILNA